MVIRTTSTMSGPRLARSNRRDCADENGTGGAQTIDRIAGILGLVHLMIGCVDSTIVHDDPRWDVSNSSPYAGAARYAFRARDQPFQHPTQPMVPVLVLGILLGKQGSATDKNSSNQ